MEQISFWFADSEGKNIFVRKWEPEITPAKGIIQIIHGISEHSRRYSRFAEELTAAGFVVYANDHRGHGKTEASFDCLGNAGSNGWNWLVRDVFELTQIAQKEYPHLPIFIFGHSMGSFILRQYMYQFGKPTGINGYILSGTGGSSYFMLKLAQFLCKWVIIKHGRKEKNKFIHELTFKDFNLKCDEKRTLFDWLSRDTKEVDKYIADPLCGQICSVGFYLDFFRGIDEIQQNSNILRIPKGIPVYIFSGEMDPVGQYSIRVKQLIDKYKRTGLNDVSYKLYNGGRHEMLNEINRDEVIKDVIQWINSKINC